MKNVALIFVAMLSGMMQLAAQSRTVEGKVLFSSDSIPVEFATVRLIQDDSVTVDVRLTDESGRFCFDNVGGGSKCLVVSSIGCRIKNVVLPCDSIIFLESSNEIAEIVVRGSKNYIKNTARGLVVSMEGNPVARLGSAAEALKQIPMIDTSRGAIAVLGYGTPLIYINNRLVRNPGELATLSADDISHIEIITNPSSKYGADVSSVLVIRTRNRNDGFHASAGGNVSVSEEWSESGNLSLNYHTESGLTFLGDLSCEFSGFRQNRRYEERLYSINATDLRSITVTEANAKKREWSLAANAGVNYDFGKHSIGLRYAFDRIPKSRYQGEASSVVDAGGAGNRIDSQSDLFRQKSVHHVNAFGNVAFPYEAVLRIDADYVDSDNQSESKVREQPINYISNANDAAGSLWSGKLTLSKKIRNIELEAGADLSYTRLRQVYAGVSSENVDFLKPEMDIVKQNLWAGYLGFDWTYDARWSLYGGLRLESTATDFRQNGEKMPQLSRSYTDWLPNIGISFNSSMRLTMYYRATVSRPSYQSLDDTYLYVTPTLWETGNPELQPALRHKIELNVSYRKFMLQSSFVISKRNIGSVYFHDEQDNINIERPVNQPRYNSFQIVAVQQLDLGLWHPTLQGVFYVQNLRYGIPEKSYCKPLYTLSLNNRFDVPGGIYAYVNVFGLGTGNQDVIYSHGAWQLSVTLNKTWKNWTLTFSANDVLNTWRQRFDTFTNTVGYLSDIKGASRYISLGVRYALNSAKGKYKGKTSRQDEIDRL